MSNPTTPPHGGAAPNPAPNPAPAAPVTPASATPSGGSSGLIDTLTRAAEEGGMQLFQHNLPRFAKKVVMSLPPSTRDKIDASSWAISLASWAANIVISKVPLLGNLDDIQRDFMEAFLREVDLDKQARLAGSTTSTVNPVTPGPDPTTQYIRIANALTPLPQPQRDTFGVWFKALPDVDKSKLYQLAASQADDAKLADLVKKPVGELTNILAAIPTVKKAVKMSYLQLRTAVNDPANSAVKQQVADFLTRNTAVTEAHFWEGVKHYLVGSHVNEVKDLAALFNLSDAEILDMLHLGPTHNPFHAITTALEKLDTPANLAQATGTRNSLLSRLRAEADKGKV